MCFAAFLEVKRMKTISIDIETYSDVNLAKCGVYKYAESRILKSSFLAMRWMEER